MRSFGYDLVRQRQVPIGDDITLQDYQRAYLGHRLECAHNHVLIVSSPKSGSTFLANCLCALFGYEKAYLAAGYDRREPELSVNRLLRYHRQHFVAQEHVRYSVPTEKLLDSFSVKPVVVVRNIFDTIVSMGDHIRRESNAVHYAYVPERMRTAEDAELLGFLTDMAAPWLFNFYVSWQLSPHRFLLTYEEVTGDTEAVLRKVAEHLGGTPSIQASEAVERALEGRSRFNVGKSGRGEELLTRAMKDRIRHFADYYPDVDFTPLGLT